MNRKAPTPCNQKKVGTWIIIMAFFLAELLLYTWCRVQSTRVGYDIAQATHQHRELTTLRNNLKIELARLKSPERITQIAKQQLGLSMPSPKQMIIMP